MKIGYLYYDLLNLFGENANFRMITKCLDDMNIEYSSFLISGADHIKFSDFDFIYIGFGTERNIEIAFNKLKKYRDDIKEYIESGKILLATGNSIELFSKDYLDILDYNVNFSKKRFLKEPILEFGEINKPLIGIFNQINTITNANLFKVARDYIHEYEGFKYKNFYGTYLIGPILVRNPEFLKFIIKILTNQECTSDLTTFEQAYDNYTTTIDNISELKKS